MAKSVVSRKDGIILSAIDIISEGGLQALSIREIAARQNMSEALLYKHFKSKEDVVVAVLDYFSCYDSAIMNTVLSKKISIKEKIMEYTRSFMEYYENYPAITAILYTYEQLMHEEATRDIVINILKKRTDYLAGLFEQGQLQGEIKDTFTPRELSEILTGYVRVVTLLWRMNSFGFSLKAKVITTISKILEQN